MIRLLRRRLAIRSYFWRLSQELARRFGKKPYYTVAEVSKTAQDGGFRMPFIAYAHAMFCSRPDFDAQYGPLHVACTYDSLRAVVGRRYFGGAQGFDAATIIRLAKPPWDEEYDQAEVSVE
jgi:hypothetical protein